MKPQHSLHTQLHLKIARLEEELRTARGMAARAQDAARTASVTQGVGLELDETGFLLIHLPGSHTLRWNLGSTQHDYAMAMKALVNVLRERRAEGQHIIATPGAPTLDELRTLTLRSNVTPKRVEPREPARQLTTITLADLGL